MLQTTQKKPSVVNIVNRMFSAGSSAGRFLWAIQPHSFHPVMIQHSVTRCAAKRSIPALDPTTSSLYTRLPARRASQEGNPCRRAITGRDASFFARAPRGGRMTRGLAGAARLSNAGVNDARQSDRPAIGCNGRQRRGRRCFDRAVATCVDMALAIVCSPPLYCS